MHIMLTRPFLYLLLYASLLACIPSRAACGADQTYGDALAHVVRVVDGDTLIVDIPAFPDVVGRNISIRLAGCDTPELRDKCPEKRKKARAAKAFVHKLLDGRAVVLRDIRRGKYFRLVARVELPDHVPSPQTDSAAPAASFPPVLRKPHSTELHFAELEAHGTDISSLLIRHGYATPYSGGKRK